MATIALDPDMEMAAISGLSMKPTPTNTPAAMGSAMALYRSPILGSAASFAQFWHASLSLRAKEGQLTDERWATIAEQFVDRFC